MKNFKLLSGTLLSLGFLTLSVNTFANDCKQSMSYLLQDYAKYGIQAIESSESLNSPIKRIGHYEFTKHNIENRVYEVDIANIVEIPVSASTKSRTLEYIEIFQSEGVNLEDAVKLVIMPDDSLHVLKGFAKARAMKALGEKTLPAEVIKWDNLEATIQRSLVNIFIDLRKDEFIQRFDEEMIQVINKVNRTDDITVEEFQAYQSFYRQWDRHVKLVELLKKKRTEVAVRSNIEQTQQAPLPGQLSGDAKDSFLKYRDEYFKKEEERLLQKEIKSMALDERERRIAHLEGDDNLIMVFDRIESSKFSVSFKDLLDYSENKLLQSAVSKWIGKVSTTKHMDEENLLSELIISMKMSLMKKFPEQTQSIDNLVATEFNNFLNQVVSRN